MAKIRFGYSDDFTAKNSSVGINTSEPQDNLEVVGVVKGEDLAVPGISSLTAYEGFLRANHQIAENTTLSFDQGPASSLSGEIIVGTGQTVTVNEVVKDTAGVGNNGNNTWINLLDNSNGNAIPYGTKPKWDGNAFVFSADGEFQVDNFSETFDTSITLEWWGSSDYPTTNYKVPAMRTTSTAWADGFGFYQYDGKVYWWVNTWNGAQRTEIAATSFGMTHWVGTYDGSNLKMYRNGSLVDTGSSFTANITDPSASFDIGSAVDNSGYRWDGSISIVRLYKTALTAAEINAQYKLGPKSKVAVVEPDVVHFNANNPLSYPGTVRDVDTTDFTRAGGSEIECLKVFNTFTPPSGGTNERPYAPKPGELYYNYDLKTIEFHDGYGWRQVDNTSRSGRGVVMGGDYSTPLGWSMEYVQIPTLGNSQYFGELEWGTYNGGSFASATRGLYAGGRGRDTYDSGPVTYSTAHVDSITIASQGNSTSWGTMSPGFVHTDSCSSSTRGLVSQGYPAHTTVYYVTIATEGEYGTFGNLTLGRHSAAGCASPTRGIFSGGSSPAPGSEIDVFTIASLGNAVEFGKLSLARKSYLGSCSNNTRGIIMGGGVPNPIYFSDMEYITIATNGNGQDFGDLTINRQNGTATATQTRGIYAGGGNPTYYNVIDYISLTSLGNAQDFGDLTVWTERRGGQAVSDSHGGLGGF